jgi:hypothetical protein
VVAAWATHDPLPDDAVKTVPKDVQSVDPRCAGDDVPDEACARAGQQSLVGELHLVEENGFLAIAPVDVTEDVQTRLDPPDFAEKMRTAEIIVAMVLLRQSQLPM